MKRIVAALFAICIFITSNAQMQTRFWGLQFGYTWSSLESAKGRIAGHCAHSFVDNNTVTAYQGTFGGYDWDIIDFHFFQDSPKAYKIFYLVTFHKIYETLESAQSTYESILNSLRYKYGYHLDKETMELAQEYDEILAMSGHNEYCKRTWLIDSYGCSLCMQYIEIQGREFISVNLTYADREYLNKSVRQSREEL